MTGDSRHHSRRLRWAKSEKRSVLSTFAFWEETIAGCCDFFFLPSTANDNHFHSTVNLNSVALQCIHVLRGQDRMQSAFCRHAKKKGGSRYPNTSTKLPSTKTSGNKEKIQTRSSLRSSTHTDANNTTERPSQQVRWNTEESSHRESIKTNSKSLSREASEERQRRILGAPQAQTFKNQSATPPPLCAPTAPPPFAHLRHQGRTGQEPKPKLGAPSTKLAQPSQPTQTLSSQSSHSSYLQKPPQTSVAFPNSYTDGFNDLSQLSGLSQVSGWSQEQGSYNFEPSLSSETSAQLSFTNSAMSYPLRQPSRSSTSDGVLGPLQTTTTQKGSASVSVGRSRAGAPSVHSHRSRSSTSQWSKRSQQSLLLEVAGMSSYRPRPHNSVNGLLSFPSHGPVEGVVNPFQPRSRNHLRDNVLRPVPEANLPLSQSTERKMRAFLRCELKKILSEQFETQRSMILKEVTEKYEQETEAMQKAMDAKATEMLVQIQEDVDDVFDEAAQTAIDAKTAEMFEQIQEDVQHACDKAAQKAIDTKATEAFEQIKKDAQLVYDKAKEDWKQVCGEAKEDSLVSIARVAQSTLASITTAGTDLVQFLVPKMKLQATQLFENCFFCELENQKKKRMEKAEVSKGCASDREPHNSLSRTPATSCPDQVTASSADSMTDTEMCRHSLPPSAPRTRSQKRKPPALKVKKTAKKRVKISPFKPLQIKDIGDTPKKAKSHGSYANSFVSPCLEVESNKDTETQSPNPSFPRAETKAPTICKRNRLKKPRTSHKKRAFADMSGFL